MKCRGFQGVYVGGAHKKAGTNDILYGCIICLAAFALRIFNVSVLLGGLMR
jgi:hypothetical protein